MAKLLQYNITEAEKQQILNGVDVDLNNKISAVEINDSDFISDLTSRIYYSPTGQCYDVTSVYVPGNMCASGEHAFGDPTCNYLLSGQTSNQATAGTTQLVYTQMDCGSGGGTEPSDIDDSGLGGGSGPTSPTGPGLPTFEGEDPCIELKKLSEKNITNATPAINIINLLNQLKIEVTPTGSCYNNGDETGYIIFPTDTSNNNFIADLFQFTGGIGGGVGAFNYQSYIGLNVLSYFMHVHGLTHYSCFTFDDIVFIYSFSKLGNINNPNSFTSFLTTAYGTNYAIKINDQQTFINKFDSFDLTDPKKLKELENMFFKNMNDKTNIENNEKQVALFLKNTGLDLYKADTNFSKWEKIIIDANGSKSSIPCNNK